MQIWGQVEKKKKKNLVSWLGKQNWRQKPRKEKQGLGSGPWARVIQYP